MGAFGRTKVGVELVRGGCGDGGGAALPAGLVPPLPVYAGGAARSAACFSLNWRMAFVSRSVRDPSDCVTAAGNLTLHRLREHSFSLPYFYESSNLNVVPQSGWTLDRALTPRQDLEVGNGIVERSARPCLGASFTALVPPFLKQSRRNTT